MSENDNDFTVNFNFDADLARLGKITKSVKDSFKGIGAEAKKLQTSIVPYQQKQIEEYRRASIAVYGGRGGAMAGYGRGGSVSPYSRGAIDILRQRSMGGAEGGGGHPFAHRLGRTLGLAARGLVALTAGALQAVVALGALTAATNSLANFIMNSGLIAKSTGDSTQNTSNLRMGMMREGISDQGAAGLMSFVEKATNFQKFGGQTPEGLTALMQLGIGLDELMNSSFTQNFDRITAALAGVEDVGLRIALGKQMGLDPMTMSMLTPEKQQAIVAYQSSQDFEEAEAAAIAFKEALGGLKASFMELGVSLTPLINVFSSFLHLLGEFFKMISNAVSFLTPIVKPAAEGAAAVGKGIYNIVSEGLSNIGGFFGLGSSSNSSESSVNKTQHITVIQNNYGADGLEAEYLAEQNADAVTKASQQLQDAQ